MRVALVTPGFSADDDDWCIPILRDLAVGLRARMDVRVYTSCFPFSSGRYTVKGVPVRSFGDGRRGRVAWWRRQRRLLDALTEDHGAARFDVVHGFWADGGGYVCARFRRRNDTPTVVTIMGGELINESLSGYGKRTRPIAGRLARYGARSAAALNVASPWHRDLIAEQQGELAIDVVRLGTDPALFNDSVAPADLQGQIPVLCVASLVRVKGHEALLRAFATASHRVGGLHLHLAGVGDWESRLRELAARLGIDEAVTFHGHVPRDELPGLYRGAAFCVLGSYFENHGMVIVEAAACGRATIGTAVGSMMQFCPPELLSPAGDVPRLAANIERLASDHAARSAASSAARRAADDGYGLDRTVEAFEATYRGLLG